jgi:hypothetical protein
LYLFKDKLIETPIANMIIAKLLKSKRSGTTILDQFKENGNDNI